jgi:hypothetical protein
VQLGQPGTGRQRGQVRRHVAGLTHDGAAVQDVVLRLAVLLDEGLEACLVDAPGIDVLARHDRPDGQERLLLVVEGRRDRSLPEAIQGLQVVAPRLAREERAVGVERLPMELPLVDPLQRRPRR